MNYQTKFCLSIALLALCCSPVQAEQLIVTPVMDATLYEDDAGALANSIGEHLFFGRVGSSLEGAEKLRRTLVRFDLSAIPPNARIDSVSLALEINKSPGVGAESGLATLHRVTASWAEGPTDATDQEGGGSPSGSNDPTWLHRAYSGSNWIQPGGDFIESASAEADYGTAVEPLEFASTAGLRADVTAWIMNPATNHGWILLGLEDIVLTARRVYARESDGQNVPTLTVDYSIPAPTDHLSLTSVTSNLTRPVVIANANDGSGRLFIVEQAGRILIFDTNTQALLPTPYLDIVDEVDDEGNEQGLLGLAFHPEFASNRKFYVYYIRDPGAALDRSVVAMYEQDEESDNTADESTKQVLMEFERELHDNHNGGDLHFGADGYLYIASGDGGGGGDQYNNAQDKNSLKGKLLRINVDGTPQGGGELCGISPQYGIPPGNAFPGTGNGCDEILHLGLRNPWKFSFDAKTEDLYIGDVGQGNYEEVDFATPGAVGLNFGWPCREGLHAYSSPPAGVTCPNPVNPVVEYSSQNGSGNCSITGGYVYRGNNTALQGYYVYADYCSNRIWMVRNQDGAWTPVEWPAAAAVLDHPTAFGQDENCELYVADIGEGGENDGALYRFDSSEVLLSSGFETLRCQ
jgi:glucose/arabinose dehydrogenase